MGGRRLRGLPRRFRVSHGDPAHPQAPALRHAGIPLTLTDGPPDALAERLLTAAADAVDAPTRGFHALGQAVRTWALGEPSRAGTAVLIIAVAVVAFLELRLDQIWSGV